eukprot:1160494-Pelagomonas_calceolata.AAC.22
MPGAVVWGDSTFPRNTLIRRSSRPERTSAALVLANRSSVTPARTRMHCVCHCTQHTDQTVFQA